MQRSQIENLVQWMKIRATGKQALFVLNVFCTQIFKWLDGSHHNCTRIPGSRTDQKDERRVEGVRRGRESFYFVWKTHGCCGLIPWDRHISKSWLKTPKRKCQQPSLACELQQAKAEWTSVSITMSKYTWIHRGIWGSLKTEVGSTYSRD